MSHCFMDDFSNKVWISLMKSQNELVRKDSIVEANSQDGDV